MGDSGALALGFILASMSVEGVLKTAATIALVGPLLVLAVPLLDTSFVVLKRLKYGRRPWARGPEPLLPPLHAHRLLPAAHGGLPTPVGDPAGELRDPAPLRSAAAAGVWDTGHVLIALAVGVLVLATSVWMVYTLEILKARHLKAVGLGRFVKEVEEVGPPETEEERQDTVERAVMSGLR